VAPEGFRVAGLIQARDAARVTGSEETLRKWGWDFARAGILSGYPVLPIKIANRLGGSK